MLRTYATGFLESTTPCRCCDAPAGTEQAFVYFTAGDGAPQRALTCTECGSLEVDDPCPNVPYGDLLRFLQPMTSAGPCSRSVSPAYADDLLRRVQRGCTRALALPADGFRDAYCGELAELMATAAEHFRRGERVDRQLHEH